MADQHLSQVTFVLLDDEEVQRMSVAAITQVSGKDVAEKTTTVGTAEDNILSQIVNNHETPRDIRLGCVDGRVMCPTCHEQGCGGHQGYIALADYVIRPTYVVYIINILSAVCFFCSKLRFNPTTAATDTDTEKSAKFKLRAVMTIEDGFERQRAVAALLKQSSKGVKFCPWCQKIQPVYRYRGALTNVIEYEFLSTPRTTEPDERWETENCAQYLVGSKLYAILDGITDADAEVLGFPRTQHPRRLMTRVQVVPSPSIRPVHASGHRRHQMLMRGDDDLTRVLQSIVRANNMIVTYRDAYREAVRTGENVKAAREMFIWCQVGLQLATYFVFKPDAINNVRVREFLDKLRAITTGVTTSFHVQRHRVGMKDILNGKGGFMRKYMAGKRVDHSARSPISVAKPDANMWTLGVPSTIMNTLTFPERATDFNLEMLRAAVRIGAKRNDGALSAFIPEQDRLVSLANMTDASLDAFAAAVRPGWIVRRHLRNGDICVFNRQPTLHKMSMMGFSIYRVPHLAFLLPIMDSTPFNADHDGDEMNFHMPQTFEAIAEIKELMFVTKCIVSPQKNAAVIGLKQDAVLGWFLLSKLDRLSDTLIRAIRESVQFDPRDEAGYLEEPNLNTHLDPALWRPLTSGIVAGIDVLGALVPLDFEYHHGGVDISRGVARGVVTSQVIGTGPSTIQHKIFLQFGPWACAKFLSDANRVAIEYLKTHSISVGWRNCVMPAELKSTVDRLLATRPPDRVLGDLCTVLMDWAKTQDPFENGLVAEILSGAKGNQTNLTQILASIGQQSGTTFRYRDRPMSLFAPDAAGPETNGLIRSSFARGTSLSEFFFSAQAGRSGLTDTAVKTALSGYVERRMMQWLKNVIMDYFGRVCDTNGQVMQLVYGGDNLDATMLEVHALYPQSWTPRTAVHDIIARVFSNRNVKVRVPLIHAEFDGDCPLSTLVPWFKSLFLAHRTLLRWPDGLDTLEDVLGFLRDNPCPLWVFACFVCVRWTRAPTNLDAIGQRYISAIVAPGEPLGALAATSMSEPATQMTMKTFHQSGLVNRNITVGLPRLQELINSQGSDESSFMNIVLREPFRECYQFAACVADSIVERTLESVMVNNELYEGSPPLCFERSPEPSLGLGTITSFSRLPPTVDVDVSADGLRGAIPPPTPPTRTVPILRITVRELSRVVADALQQYVTDAACVLATSDTEVLVWIDDVEFFCARFSEITDKTHGYLQDFYINVLADKSDVDKQLFVHGILTVWVNAWKTLVISGFKDVRKAFVKRRDREFIVETEGSNPGLWLLPYVDPNKTYCSNAKYAVARYGIENCNVVLSRELCEVLSAGYGVDPRHIQLLADVMTQNGEYLALTRHNMMRGGVGVLQRAGYEETATVLTRAGAFGQSDQLEGASRLFLGMPSKVGTGLVEIVADHHEDLKYVAPLDKTHDERIARRAEEFLGRAEAGGGQDLDYVEPMPTSRPTDSEGESDGEFGEYVFPDDMGLSERAWTCHGMVRRSFEFTPSTPESLDDFYAKLWQLRSKTFWTSTPSAWDFGAVCFWDGLRTRTELDYHVTVPIHEHRGPSAATFATRVNPKNDTNAHFVETVVCSVVEEPSAAAESVETVTLVVKRKPKSKKDVPPVTPLAHTIVFQRCRFATDEANVTIRLEHSGRTFADARRAADRTLPKVVIELTTTPVLQAFEHLVLGNTADNAVFTRRDAQFNELWTKLITWLA